MTLPADGPGDDPARFRFNVLGPFEARYDDTPIHLTGVARSVLAVLTPNPGRVVSVAGIVAGLWGTEPPDGAERAVPSYVSRLRRSLAAASDDVDATAVLVTRAPGYVLAVPPSSIDAVVFETYLEQARRATAAAQPGLAAERYRQALALWRGEAYAEFPDHPFAERQRARLEELRIGAVQARIDAVLAAGLPAGDVVADLEALVAEHPHRERMWVQLMTALYREGRQADALDAYRRARSALVEHLGVEPGVALREAERAVLVGDPALAPPPPAVADVPAELALGAGACVGRDLELSWLTAQLDEAAFTGGRACLVVGPAGIGKTRLMAELAGRAAARGVSVRYGRGERGVDALAGGPELHLVILDDVDRLSAADLHRVDVWLRVARGQRPVLTVLTYGDDLPPAPLAELPRLALTPLSRDHVATVVRIYSPDAPDAAVSQIAERAAGVPAQVHHVARDWAAARAGHRIDQAVVHLGDRRRRLETVRADIVAGVLEVGRVRDQAGAYGGAGQTVACPYKGLARFERADAEYFHGRDRLVAELVARLVDASLVAVVGASGSGKSSVVRAGLLAALQAGVLPGSGAWRQVVLTPATAMAGLPDPVDDRTILVVDQFEEAFTVLSDEARDRFVGSITGSLDAGSTTVVLCIRSDYYARCAEHPVLGALVAATTVLVPRMAGDELRQAVERPAALAGLRIEDGLVDLLVDQAREAPGALPLLSVALVSLWERRSGRTLTVAGYRDTAGVAGSVERLGEQAFAALHDAEQRDAARRILLRLASSTDGRTITARRADRGELAAVGGQAAAQVLDVLASRRLVSVADGTVEVAHEALFTHWPRLRNWLADDASGRTLRAHLAPAARAWADGSRDPGELYRGARLAAVLDWAASRSNELLPIERQFLEAGRAAAVAEQVRQRRNVRLLRTLLVAAFTALAVAIAGGLVAVNQQRRAEAAGRVADAKRLGSQALIDPDLPRAMLLAAAATRLDDSWQTRGNLLATLLRTPNLVHATTIGDGDRVSAQAMSPDGRLIAVAGFSGTIRVMDAATLRPTATLAYPGGRVHGMSFTLDSKRLVTWGGDSSNGSSGHEVPATNMLIWDLDSKQPLGQPFGRPVPVDGAILADGRTVVVHQFYVGSLNATAEQLLAQAPTPERAVAWDLQTRQQSQLIHLPDTTATNVNVSADRRKVLLDGPDGMTVVDAFTGSTRLLPGVHGFPALSPDGHTLAVADPQGPDIAVWDLATGKLKGLARRHTAPVASLAWSPDGSTFASAGGDSLVVVWDTSTLTPRLELAGHAGPVSSISFSTDGRTVYSGGQDSMLLAWDISNTRTLDRLVHGPSQPPVGFDYIGFDPNTREFYFDIVGDHDVLVHRVSADTGAEVGAPIRLDPDENVVQLSPNGRYLSVGYGNGEGQVLDASTGGRLTGRVATSGKRGRFADTDPTGRILAVADRDLDPDFTSRVELFDVATGHRIDPPIKLSANNNGLRFSPDGRYLAAGMGNGKVAIFDVRAHRLVTELAAYPKPMFPVLEFSPDGRLLVVGGGPGQLTAWHVGGAWTRAWTANVITDSPTGTISFSPNGQLLTTSGNGGNLLLFDAMTGEAIGTALIPTGASAFAPDGSTLLTLGPGLETYRWDVDPRSWLRRACDIAGRQLTADEWQRYLPGRARLAVCPVDG